MSSLIGSAFLSYIFNYRNPSFFFSVPENEKCVGHTHSIVTVVKHRVKMGWICGVEQGRQGMQNFGEDTWWKTAMSMTEGYGRITLSWILGK
jgi:hypothetical protein